MSHLLIVDLPAGSDSAVLEAALRLGHRFTLLTADAAHYRAQPALAATLARGQVMEAPGMAMEATLAQVRAAHARDPFGAVLCLQDLRLAEAAQIAAALGLRHLNPATAALCRDKGAVRARLAAAGLPQPAGTVVRNAGELLAAVEQLGLPLIVKPVDGFGSQHVFALRDARDLAILQTLAPAVAEGPGDYGLGVAPCGALLVERLLDGPVVACDTMSANGRHRLLGVNEKLFFAPPSFTIRGGCFTTNTGQFAGLEACLFALLDAVGFDHGAAHIELALTPDGPQLIDLNPRLVGAGLARLIEAARGRCAYQDLIALHLEGALPPPATATRHAAARWIAADAPGTLEAIDLPAVADPGLVGVMLLAEPGAMVGPPLDNADRLGCVMTCGADAAATQALADAVVAGTRVLLRPQVEQLSA